MLKTTRKYIVAALIGLDDRCGQMESPSVGVGTLVILLDTVMLSLYVFSCHSFRHLVGGMKDIMSKSPVRKKAFDCVTCLNARHMRFAWFSLFWVGFSDLYVRMCAMGIWKDIRLF